MKMPIDKFMACVTRAYQAGYDGRDQEDVVSSILGELGPVESETEAEYRIYSIEELKAAPDGATFVSEVFGPFRLFSYQGEKMGEFVSQKFSHATFNSQYHPWDRGVRRVSEDEYEEIAKNYRQ